MTVSILLNVLNGAKTLQECLESVAGLADEVVAVIDTRTTDNTAAILSDFSNRHPNISLRVYYFTWADSFSEARNFALERCRCDWVFQIDHDETLDPKSIPVIKDAIERHSAIGIAHSVLDLKANGTGWFPAMRLFRNNAGISYVRRKHNIPIMPEGAEGAFFPHIVLYHTGYDLPPEEMKAKHERDEKLILMELEEDPLSIFAHRSLIRTYRADLLHDKVIEWTQRLFDVATQNDIEISPSTYQMVWLDLLGTYIDLEDYEKAEEVGKQLITEYPDNVDGHFAMGILYTGWEKYHEAVAEFEKYLELLATQKQQPINNQLIIEHWGSEHVALNNIAWANSVWGKHKKAARYLRRAIELKPDSNPIRQAFQYELGNIASGDPLNILFVQNVTSSRNRKLAKALRAQGHKVSLAYSQENRFANDTCYDEVIHIETESILMQHAPQYDIIHCMDTPGYFAARLEEYTNCIIVRDIHDISELFQQTPFLWTVSGFSARHANGLTFSTPQQLYKMHEIHGINLANSMYIMNYASRGEKPQSSIPKLSGRDGAFHIVYEGYVGTKNHVDMMEIFHRLAENHIHVHIYPAVESLEYAGMAQLSDYIHYHDPIPFDQLIMEMTQYDAGIVPWNLERGNKDYLDSTIANKVFDYVLAGLPVITCNSRALAWYVTENDIGIVYDTVDDIIARITELKTMNVSEKAEYMEDHIDTLIGFYRMMIRQKYKPYQPGITLEATDIIALEESDPDKKTELYFTEDGKWQYEKDRINRIVELAEGDVLDIGCADGVVSILCARRGLKATGMDISPLHIMNCADNINKEPKEVRKRVEFIRSDAQEKQDGKRYDTVIMGQLLEHVVDPDVVIENAIDLLANNGKLIATVPNGFLYDKKHLRYFDESSFKCLLEQHCAVKSIEHIGPRMLAICEKDRSEA